MTQPTFRLPGLVDIHVHLRDPGQTHKEDFFTGTAAALAGGYTTVFDMPNNLEPITTLKRLEQKIDSAKAKTVCDIGFHFGSLADNFDQFERARPLVAGLKLYLNVTTGGFIITPDKLRAIYEAWACPKPILVHAEADVISDVLKLAAETGQRTHICHVSSQAELEPILRAKEQGAPVTCGVTPHHLFLTEADTKRLGPFASMKPVLKTQADLDFIWAHLDGVDVIESDHAPHTKAEKEAGTAPFGVPGLETTLALMLQAEQEGRLSRDRLVELCAATPRRILGLPDDPETYIEVAPESFTITADHFKSKAGWTPFAGRTGFGRVQAVYLRGTKVFAGGEVLAKPGSGRVLAPLA